MTGLGVTFIKNPSICDSVGHAISAQQYELICCEHSTSPWSITISSVPLTWIIMPAHPKNIFILQWLFIWSTQTKILSLRFPGEQLAARRQSWRQLSPLGLGFKPVQCQERGRYCGKMDNLMLNSSPLPSTELHSEILGLSQYSI